MLLTVLFFAVLTVTAVALYVEVVLLLLLLETFPVELFDKLRELEAAPWYKPTKYPPTPATTTKASSKL